MVGRLSICCTILGRDFNPTQFVNVHVNFFVNVVDLHGKSITVVQQPGLDIFEPQQEPKCCIPLLTESGKARKSWPSEVCSARNIAPASASWRQWHSWRRSDHTNHPGEWQESHKLSMRIPGLHAAGDILQLPLPIILIKAVYIQKILYYTYRGPKSLYYPAQVLSCNTLFYVHSQGSTESHTS